MEELLGFDEKHRTQRLYKRRIGDYVVGDDDLAKRKPLLLQLIRELDGPSVEWDTMRQCHGLMARKCYGPGEWLFADYGHYYDRKY